MKSHLKFDSTSGMSQDIWLRYRLSGLGGSDVSTVLGLNPYRSAAALFYEKLNMDINTLENLSMFLGKESEDFIAMLWQYWPKDQDGRTDHVTEMIANYRKQKVIRKCQRVNAYCRNPKYPWLFVSLDRKINKYDNRGEGILELKRMSSYSADKWTAGIDPGHVTQVQTQMLVTELDWGELAVLKDGPDYSVYPFEANKTICEAVIEKTKDFWDRVVRGRQLLTRQFDAKRNFNIKAAQECEAELQALEPEPDGTQAYAEFLKKKYTIDNPAEKKGTADQLQIAQEHKRIAEKVRELEAEALLCENQLKRAMGDQCNTLTFGDNGLITWRSDINNVRRFVNKVHLESSK